jgi:hypothetical protein
MPGEPLYTGYLRVGQYLTCPAPVDRNPIGRLRLIGEAASVNLARDAFRDRVGQDQLALTELDPLKQVIADPVRVDDAGVEGSAIPLERAISWRYGSAPVKRRRSVGSPPSTACSMPYSNRVLLTSPPQQRNRFGMNA